MSTTMNEKTGIITDLLNATYKSLKSIVPVHYEMSKPRLLGKSLELQFGVLIGVTGDIKGRLILAGHREVFGAIGESMFGMPLDGEMLSSFSGELGNMIAGGISTTIVENDLKTDITAPTIMEGNTRLSGYENAIQVTAEFENIGGMNIYLLLN